MSCSCNTANTANTAGTAYGNLVYLTKVYFDKNQTSCPILYNLTTTDETFTQQLTFSQPRCGTGTAGTRCRTGCGCSCGCGTGCGCCDFTVNAGTTFRVTDSHITVTGFTLSQDTTFEAGDVTVDGFPVTALMQMNGQYVADLSSIMEDITDCPCTTSGNGCHCMPADRCGTVCENGGHFFLAQVPGPWVLGAAVILEGTASNGPRTCNFRLCFRTIPGEEDPGILIPGSDNFAMYCVEIPCQTGGIAPNLAFDFDACASLLNPEITVTCTEEGCTLALDATLVLTPEIELKVTKPALFRLNAAEIMQPCDNVGQCDPCIAEESCCDTSFPSTEAAAQTRTGRACQCCETNGYTF